MSVTRPRSRFGRAVLLLGAGLAAVSLAAGCGGGGSRSGGTAGEPAGGKGLVAEVASFDLAAGRDQRFIVGLFSNDQGTVSFGEVRLSFGFLGTSGATQREPEPGPAATASFLPIPGQDPPADTTGPRYTSASEARGVYGVDAVRFDRAGFWQVEVTAELDGRTQRATAAFQVADRNRVPAPGDDAPRTQNLLAGAAGAPPTAVDSRAGDDGTVPDPELHRVTVADAIAAHRPVMVVVSTPVFCVSRFCGPITDTVQQLARRYGDRMDFVHLEVWRDYEKNQVNQAAAEWIWPDRQGDAQEPWVFLVGADGKIVQRWDNVATEASLTAAVRSVTGATS